MEPSHLGEPWSWRNRLTPQTDPEDSPFDFSTPLLNSSALITPPSSGVASERTLPPSGSETPRSHKLSLGISSLPRELTCKCSVTDKLQKNNALPSIQEETEPSDVRKRRLNAPSHFSPKKKFCYRPGTPKKLSQVICCHHKENSPIKIDFGRGSTFPFLLKPPPRKLDAPCPAHGRKHVDILGEMASRNMYKVLQQVVSYLSPMDFVRASAVSTTWRDLILEVSTGSSLSKSLQNALKSKENLPLEEPPSGSNKSSKSVNETTPLKHFIVQNNNPSPKRRPVLELSPPSKRFASHLQVAKTLEKGGTLTKCPRCRSPAPVIPGRATSTCSECKYSFCPQCRCSSHIGPTCRFTIPSSPETPPKIKSVIGSKTSKRALRRLLN